MNLSRRLFTPRLVTIVAPTESATVLFVDDDEDVRSTYRAYFEGEPAVSATTAASIEQARSTLGGADVDCLVSDGLRTDDGELFVEVVSRTHPDLPVILASASSRATWNDPDVDAVIRKGVPGDYFARLTAAITSALEETTARSSPGESGNPRSRAHSFAETWLPLERGSGTWHVPRYTDACWGQPGVPKCLLCRLRYAWWHLRHLRERRREAAENSDTSN